MVTVSVRQQPTAPTVIFLSYPRKLAAQSQLLKLELQRRGWRVWMDLESMSSGRWTPQIEKAIRESSDVVLLISREAATSSVMKQEASLAVSLGKPLVPVLMEELGEPTPEWIKGLLEHQAAKLDPLDSVVTVARIAKLLSTKPGRAREMLRRHWRAAAAAILVTVLLVGTGWMPTQYNNANVRPPATGGGASTGS